MHHIDVAHADERDLGMFPNLLDNIECLFQRHALFERHDARLLDNGAVRHRVGERQTELDHIRARFLRAADNIDGLFRIRAARRDVDIESLAPLFAQLR